MGIGKFCNHNYRILFRKTSVTVFYQENYVILRGWQEPTGDKLWHFSLHPQSHPSILTEWRSTPLDFNDHDLPSIGSLVWYLHAAAGFPVKSTWLAVIHAGSFASYPGLTLANASKYCPSSVESFKVHLTQSLKGVRSTKKKAQPISLNPLPKIISQLSAV